MAKGEAVDRGLTLIALEVREGRFQRWLSLAAGLSSVLSGLEVGYEHYKGSFSQRIMYTPVVLSVVLTGTGVAGFFSKTAAKTMLPAVSAVTLADGAIGFWMHVRGVQRKPGGWRLPVTNIVMGPPLFAPLLFGVAAYLGLIASQLRRGDDADASPPKPAHAAHWAARSRGVEPISPEQSEREARFRRHLATATCLAAALSGCEAWYSHYKNRFRYWVEYTPLAVSLLLVLTSAAAVASRRVAQTALPAVSGLAILNGTIGAGFHVRGVLRRPGGTRKLAYNIFYGPPVFAPLLFAASGFLGVLASFLDSEPS